MEDWNWQPWAIAGLGLITTIMGWFARQLWDAVQKLRADLDALRVHLAEHYPSYDRLEAILKPMQDLLIRIDSKLDQKVDKP